MYVLRRNVVAIATLRVMNAERGKQTSTIVPALRQQLGFLFVQTVSVSAWDTKPHVGPLLRPSASPGGWRQQQREERRRTDQQYTRAAAGSVVNLQRLRRDVNTSPFARLAARERRLV